MAARFAAVRLHRKSEVPRRVCGGEHRVRRRLQRRAVSLPDRTTLRLLRPDDQGGKEGQKGVGGCLSKRPGPQTAHQTEFNQRQTVVPLDDLLDEDAMRANARELATRAQTGRDATKPIRVKSISYQMNAAPHSTMPARRPAIDDHKTEKKTVEAAQRFRAGKTQRRRQANASM